ncbi:MAG: hypothetical protein SFV18_11880 [Bryobacteraceae bacterium]|nr:hypothetical protein [Bryobacteraceae bacterium]
MKRREALVVLGAAAAPATAAEPKFLTAAEFGELAKLVDAILPRTDTPGASDALAHVLIDERCAANAEFGGRIRSMIAALKGLPNGWDRTEHFRVLKDATIDAYYSTRDGLQTELGWNANTYLPEWKGCTHEEHR